MTHVPACERCSEVKIRPRPQTSASLTVQALNRPRDPVLNVGILEINRNMISVFHDGFMTTEMGIFMAVGPIVHLKRQSSHMEHVHIFHADRIRIPSLSENDS